MSSASVMLKNNYKIVILSVMPALGKLMLENCPEFQSCKVRLGRKKEGLLLSLKIGIPIIFPEVKSEDKI